MIQNKAFIKRRRHLVSVGIAGGGTKTAFFDKRPKPAFEEVKGLYFKEVLDRSRSTELHFSELTKKEQKKVKRAIKRKLAQQHQWYYGRFAFIFLLFAVSLFYVYNL